MIFAGDSTLTLIFLVIKNLLSLSELFEDGILLEVVNWSVDICSLVVVNSCMLMLVGFFLIVVK